MDADLVNTVLALIIAMVLHELAHGLAARAFGDRTAEHAGRLTLNPLKHIDRYGSILLPLMLAAGQLATIGRVAFLYGWAKPVPVQPLQLRLNGVQHPRELMAVVAAAGPAMNFALALLGGILLHTGQVPGFLGFFIQINLLLGIFNLLPVPPMDGGRIAVGLLPLALARPLARGEKYGILLVFLMLFVLPLVLQGCGIAFDPFQAAMGKLLPGAEQIVLNITGNGHGN